MSERSGDYTSAGELQRLKALLLGREAHDLERIGQLLHDREALIKTLSEVVAEAIQQRTQRDEDLHQVLQSSIERSLQTSIERDAKRFADLLFPIMGPAIRKAINAAIQGMFATLNQLLEQSLSARSFLWRIEAWRTGEPFAKVALLRTLVFQVEQVFLVHGETGLLITHAQRADAMTRDPDMISGMLTAIQDFVADSFAVGDDESLSAMAYGRLTLVIHRGPYAVLAAAIRGNYPASVQERLSETIETLHRLHGRELRDFSGDMQHFPDVRLRLEACLIQQIQGKDTETRSRRPWLAIAVLGLAGGLSLAWFIGHHLQQRTLQHQRHRLVTQLQQEPGYVIINTQQQDDAWVVSGLRDPLAQPETRLLDPAIMTKTAYLGAWRPYLSLDPKIVERRARQQLHLPATVSLQFQDGTLRLSGEAPAAWIKQLSEQNIPGVDSIDMQALRPLYPAHWHSWEALLAQLHKEPGYRITGSQAQAGRYVLEGRKDPLARDLKDIAGEDIYTKLGLQTAWEPYLSIEPEIVLKRAVQTLDIPATVTPQLVGERLVLTGQADQRWVAKVSVWPEAIVGIDTIDATRVKPLDADRQAYAAAARAIHAVVFYFASAQASLPPDPSFLAAIERVRDQYHRLSAKAAAIGQRFRIQVIGYTDHRGDPQRNRELQQERALFILERLVQAGIPRAMLVVGVAGDRHSPESARRFQSSMRKVELRVQDPQSSEGRISSEGNIRG